MKEEMSFEQAMKELEKIVNDLEQGEMPLEDSIEAFQKGVSLSKLLENKLDNVEKKISILVEDQDGEVLEKPFEDIKIPEDSDGI